MPRYEAIIEYAPSTKLDEEAMIEVEHQAFNKALPHIRGKGYSMLKIETHCQRLYDYADLSAVRCTIYLEEA